MLSPIEQLKEYVWAIHPLSDEAWTDFAACWQPFACKRKMVLTAAGETERHLYFVLEGVQRSFYIGKENQEATLVFTYPFSFSGVADSFLTQRPSIGFFETLTASSFLRTSYSQMEKILHTHSSVMEMVLKGTSFALHGVLQRQVELQCFSAEEKFRALMKRSPHLLQMIPHKYLASYLGIDASTFSKLMSTVKIG